MRFTILYLLMLMVANTSSAQLPDEPGQEPIEVQSELTSTFDRAPMSAPSLNATERAAILTRYSHLDPQRLIRTSLLEAAVLYYDANYASIQNKNVLSIIDFAKPSNKKRFFIVNMQTGAVWAIRVAHGRGSDANHDGYAETFSNRSGSNASSLGFYRTAGTYNGQHGRSLNLHGLSNTNSNAYERRIVIHSATYVRETNAIQGRSHGCPAVAPQNRDRLIDMIQQGSIIYAAR